MRTKPLLLCTLMLTASLAIAHHVKTDYDRSAEFYRYTTFMWNQGPNLANCSMNEHIINAVNAELQGKGLHLVASNADLAVSANTAACDTPKLKTFDAMLPGGWSWIYNWSPLPSITVVETFSADTLLVQLLDNRTQRVVWWAAGTETVSEKSEKNIKHLNRAIEKMFENFPPVRLVETD